MSTLSFGFTPWRKGNDWGLQFHLLTHKHCQQNVTTNYHKRFWDTLLLPRKAKRGKTLLLKNKGSSVTIFFMFHKIPQHVLAKDQPHFGTRFMIITIKIGLLVELINLPNFLKQNGEWLNIMLPNLLGIMDCGGNLWIWDFNKRFFFTNKIK